MRIQVVFLLALCYLTSFVRSAFIQNGLDVNMDRQDRRRFFWTINQNNAFFRLQINKRSGQAGDLWDYILRRNGAVVAQNLACDDACGRTISSIQSGSYELEIKCDNPLRFGPCRLDLFTIAVDCFCAPNQLRTATCLTSSFGSARTASCITCPAGRVCNGDATNLICPAGHYCPAGTTLASQFTRKCDAGRFCTTGQSQRLGNGPCNAGRFCPLGSTTANGAGQCDGGFHCPTGSSVRTGTGLCAAGTYCLPGNTAPVQCPEGRQCPAGTAVFEGTVCPVGNRCPAGSGAAFICAVGFQRRQGTSSCDVCTDGFHCDGSGTEGNRMPCPVGFFCSGGSITACDPLRFCPIGSIAQGPPCYNQGTQGFGGNCVCFDFFSGALCDHSTSINTGANVTVESEQYTDEALTFLHNDTLQECGCDAFFDGETCVEAADGVQFLSQLFLAGIKTYKNNTFDLTVHAFEKAITCSQVQDWTASSAQLTSILQQIKDYLFSRRADTFSTIGEAWALAFTQLLVNVEHLLAVSDPSAYDTPFEFGSVTDAETFHLAHSPAFKFCTTAGVQQFADDCGTNIEEILSLASCGHLLVEDLDSTLASQEMFVAQALYCARSIRSLVEEEFGQERLNLASAAIVDAAATVDSNYGPTESTAQLVNLAATAAYDFSIDGENRTIPVPVQPVLFFENNLASKVLEIQAFAAKLGRDQRFSLISNQISSAQARITSEITGGFSNLTGLLLDVNVGIQKQFQADAVLNAEVTKGELEALVDTWTTEVARIDQSSIRFSEYVELLSGERVSALLAGLEELVEIQFDRDSAIAAIAKAQATLNLIKSVVAGVAAIALSAVGFPMAGALVAAGVQAVPLRRRLELMPKLEKLEPLEDHMLAVQKSLDANRPAQLDSYRKLLGCTSLVASDAFEFLGKLSQRGLNFATKIKSQLANKGQLLKVFGFALKTTLLGFEAALLGKDCLSENAQTAQSVVTAASLFLGGYTAKTGSVRAIFTVRLAYQLSGFDANEEANEIKEIVAPYLACNSTGRRLRAQLRRKLAGCNILTSFAKATKRLPTFKGTALLKPLGGIAKQAGKLLTEKTLGKALGVAGGALDIALGVKAFIGERAAAEALAARADDNLDVNNANVNGAIETLKNSLLLISDAFLSVIVRLDYIQLGHTYDEVVISDDGLGDAFKFLPEVWEDVFVTIMDVLEYEALICPQIESQSIIQGAEAAFKERLDDRNTGARSLSTTFAERMKEKSDATVLTPRRSLGPKKDKKEAQAKLKEANERFREVSERMDQVECRRFERTLRSTIDWGKSIHEGVFGVVQKYREFERLIAKQQLVKDRAAATNATLERAKQRHVDFLNSLPGDTERRSEIEAYAKASGAVETELQIMAVVDKVGSVLEEFCNAHFYVDPSKRPSACNADLFALERDSSTFEEFLLSVAGGMNSLIEASSRDWFEVAYSSFSEYDDELLDVTELVDMEQFELSGFKNISFGLNGPPVAAYGTDPFQIPELRNGPYFCKYDNIGMTSFGLIFVDADGEIISDEDVEIGVSVSLSGPFIKTSGGTRKSFSLREYDSIVYRYSRPKTLEGTRYCRTDESPTLFGEICDKGRSFEIETDGLNTQPLPSPYAKWDVIVTQGFSLLAQRGVAGIKVITTFNAIRNEQMQCRGERLDYLNTFSIATVPENNSTVAAAGGIIGALAVVAVAAIFVVYRRRRQASPELGERGEETVTTKNPSYEKSNDEVVIEKLKRQVSTMEKAFTKIKSSLSETDA